ncbi:MAG TPA: isoprenyl transferase [Aggregatilineales bacterium]|nr:isoprenyl transferase [Aggregatilineales bacterium]
MDVVRETPNEDVTGNGLNPANVPTHIAVIMDGNGRWAKQRGLPRLAGHQAGTENLREVLRACVTYGVKILTIYAFSTENWGRPQEEVRGLMSILNNVIDRELDELDAEGVQIRHLGDLARVEPSLAAKVREAVERTKHNDRLILNVAFNYGGRAEIIHAIREIVAHGFGPEEIDEELVSHYMYTGDLPDPDLIIRTSGELRLSNFLIWQSAYAEYYFPEVYWPDFNKEELYKALLHYADRDRRFGRVG